MAVAQSLRLWLIVWVELTLKFKVSPQRHHFCAHAPTKLIWAADESGVQQRREVAKRIKRWWVENIDGTAQLTIRYGSKPLELVKGKNAIECESVSVIATILEAVKQAVIDGEFDSILNGQVSAVKRVKQT